MSSNPTSTVVGRSMISQLAGVIEHPWALTETYCELLANILAAHFAHVQPSAAELEAAIARRERLPQPKGGGVAVVPVHGVLIPRGDLFSEMSGATSMNRIAADIAKGLEDEDVSTIVLDIDSPGGSVAGATELARYVMRARTQKPIIAQASYTAASAAYWLAAAATSIAASPSGLVGSIGVYAMHDNIAKALEKLGVERTLVSAGKYKTEGHPFGPLSEDARADAKKRVDISYRRFTADVAAGRGVPVDDVRSGFGEGRMITSDEALELKMIDRVATLEETIDRARAGHKTVAAKTAAAAPTPTLDAAANAAAVNAKDPDADTAKEQRAADARALRALEDSLASLRVSGIAIGAHEGTAA